MLCNDHYQKLDRLHGEREREREREKMFIRVMGMNHMILSHSKLTGDGLFNKTSSWSLVKPIMAELVITAMIEIIRKMANHVPISTKRKDTNNTSYSSIIVEVKMIHCHTKNLITLCTPVLRSLRIGHNFDAVVFMLDHVAVNNDIKLDDGSEDRAKWEQRLKEAEIPDKRKCRSQRECRCKQSHISELFDQNCRWSHTWMEWIDWRNER